MPMYIQCMLYAAYFQNDALLTVKFCHNNAIYICRNKCSICAMTCSKSLAWAYEGSVECK